MWGLGGPTTKGETSFTVAGTWTLVSSAVNPDPASTVLRAQIYMNTPNKQYNFDGAQLLGA